jgi:formate dehydrogenase subunit gamma
MNGSQEQILRFTFAERSNHWIAAFSYIYCLVTGLAIWTPYMFWLAVLVGGGALARFWHPIIGVLFAISMLVMLKHWGADMHTAEADRAWWALRQHYIRNEDAKLPPVGRFNAGQKIFFWTMLISTVLLLLSGIGLWFVESIPPWLRSLSILVHVVFGLVTIGLFIIHVYMGTAMMRGSFHSIVRGSVSRAWAKAHHRLWYDQVTGQRSSR